MNEETCIPPAAPNPGGVEEERDLPGVIVTLAAMPAGALVTERGLAQILCKCTASIKAAVDRGELPPPVRFMGKPTWTASSIVRWHEDRLSAEVRKHARLRPTA